MTLGSVVRAERRRRGWSLRQLSERSGLGIATLSRIENGQQVGHADTIARIGSALELPADEVNALLLAAREPDPPAPDPREELIKALDELMAVTEGAPAAQRNFARRLRQMIEQHNRQAAERERELA